LTFVFGAVTVTLSWTYSLSFLLFPDCKFRHGAGGADGRRLQCGSSARVKTGRLPALFNARRLFYYYIVSLAWVLSEMLAVPLEEIEKECDEYFKFDHPSAADHNRSLQECITIGDIIPGVPEVTQHGKISNL